MEELMTEPQTAVHTPPAPLATAVLFLVFNRPDTTRQVFEAIRHARPPRLYIAADGPRPNKAGEVKRCAEVRSMATSVDWPCEVRTLFRRENLGCKRAVSGGINWFFEHEEQGIILEDDCLPSQSFFWFCEDMLERYKNDERIFIVSGYNKQQSWKPEQNDYFFSNFGGIWGWATWRRAWRHYDIDMVELEQKAREGYFENLLGMNLGKLRKQQLLGAKKNILSGQLNTWDFQWGFTRHLHRGLACVPSVSLIENIGFSADATHTQVKVGKEVSRAEIKFPIKNNLNITPDPEYDQLFIGRNQLWIRIFLRLRRLFE